MQVVDAASQLIEELGCGVCHAGVVASAETVRAGAPSLSNAGQYDPSHIFSYLQDPQRIRRDIGASRMPAFGLDERERLALTLYLETLSGSGGSSPGVFVDHFASKTRGERRALDRSFARSRRTNHDVTTEAGATLFAAFNCVGCHETEGMQPAVVGPDLSTVGRLRADWVADYVRSPVAIRPFGFHPGSGARMPDFSLSGEEARLLTDHLLAASSQTTGVAFSTRSLSVFAEDKALRLIRDRLACLGCHRLGGEGGRIGPDLSNVGGRLGAQSIYAMLTAPQRQVPGSIMPHRPMPEDRIELIASFLARQNTATTDSYASPLDYISVQPTAGASGDMSTRPDDTLFDGIHAGAYILGKSHRMPAFGQRLTSDETRRIVSYMRDLCRCVGPAWSRDGRGS